MHIAGNYTLNATPGQIWPHIFNPDLLMRLIPGAQSVQQTSPNEYKSVINIGLPAIVGRYETTIKLADYEEPTHCTFDGYVDGNSGTISGTASFVLKEVEPGKTLVEYQADAIISGPLARLKSRFIEGVAQALIDQSLSKLNRELKKDTE